MNLLWEEEGKILMGCGVKKSYHEIPSPSPRCFGGLSFSKNKKESLWQEFPDCFFFEPKILSFSEKKSPQKLRVKNKRHLPDLAAWKKQVAYALEKIAKGKLDKVVLARRTTFTFEQQIDPASLFHQLPSTNVTRFLFQPSPTVAFLGATPERLYIRDKDNISAEALAGTWITSYGKKEEREFNFVKQFIDAKLSPFCHALAWGENSVLKTSSVQHLHNRCHGELKKTTSDAELIATLHPTPAMAGYPQKEALDHLEEVETFDRGWYAAPIGWTSSVKSHIAIGIRSALIRGNEIHLFAAAGIVKGSRPEKEWEELEMKISTFERIFYE